MRRPKILLRDGPGGGADGVDEGEGEGAGPPIIRLSLAVVGGGGVTLAAVAEGGSCGVDLMPRKCSS